jgi:hypothetical protein
VRAAAAARAAALRKLALIESEVLATRPTVVRVWSEVRTAERPEERAVARTTEQAAGTCEEDALAETKYAADRFCAGLALAEGVLLRV